MPEVMDLAPEMFLYKICYNFMLDYFACNAYILMKTFEIQLHQAGFALKCTDGWGLLAAMGLKISSGAADKLVFHTFYNSLD